MKNYDFRKMEIEELKKKLVEHFKSGKGFDSTLSSLMKELKLKLEDLDLLEYCLEELVEEEWIKKSKSLDHNEYDPGKRLDFGGIM
ncbi:hypothetical protein A3K73_04570 [Candidatus Pacearchaeota archaeon RBG_13_36_9]|nr:MAG: hypothetical protein A3K73_04570 [Candidatus Pacearchaeota archaeon RBG_13_36_9]HJX49883.1 hypothetical protein [Candidatus Nanoarchaeia archaeon]